MIIRRFRDELKPVGIGLLLGVISLFFGILWVAYLTVNHEKIHAQLSAGERAAVEEKFVISPSGGHEGHDMSREVPPAEKAPMKAVHEHGGPVHEGHEGHSMGAGALTGEDSRAPENPGRDEGPSMDKGAAAKERHGSMHDTPEMEEAHERLVRGHLHAMGLGTMTIAVSLLLALIPAPARWKTLASACVGTGSLFYPLAWIVMGFRTTSLGIEAAAESVIPMVGFSVLFVLAGLVLTLFFLVKWLLRGS